MFVYKIWIQYTNLFKSYRTETIFQSWKRAITPKIIDGFYSKSNLTYIFLIIYQCTKFQSNTPTLSKDITQKPFFKVENFSKLKRAITPKIIGGFYPKSNLTYILWLYTCVYNFNSIHQSFQKISHGNQKCYVWDGRDGWMYGQWWYYMPPPPPPLKMVGA